MLEGEEGADFHLISPVGSQRLLTLTLGLDRGIIDTLPFFHRSKIHTDRLVIRLLRTRPVIVGDVRFSRRIAETVILEIVIRKVSMQFRETFVQGFENPRLRFLMQR